MPKRRTRRKSPRFRRFIRELASRVHRKRVAREWSRRQLAERVGVGVAVIRRIEMGATNPSLALLVSVAHALGIRLTDLLRGANDH